MGIKFSLVSALLITATSYSQGSNSNYSPYSVFGLGRFNDANTGITNSLGKSGMALGSEYEINGLNPASLAKIGRNSFFFDIGLKAEYNTFGNNKNTDTKQTLYNFSNVTIAFPIGKKSGLSISLLPYTEVGYFFQGIVTDIVGTGTNTLSTITGNGGLNSFTVNYGRVINPKLSLGLSAKYFFGSIKQTELVQIENDLLSIQDINYYKGYKFEVGMQYQLSKTLTSGATVNFPSILNGSRDREVAKLVNQTYETIESNEGTYIDNYKTPFDFSMGVKYDYKNYSLLTDYKRTFWSSTGIVDNIGKYTDSNIIGIGLEYFRKGDGIYRAKPKSRYRLGYNYDDGNLRVNGEKISNSTFTAGIGFPFGKSYGNYLNISYSYGTKGLISNTLVKENYHTVTFNLSFGDSWFQKRLFE